MHWLQNNNNPALISGNTTLSHNQLINATETCASQLPDNSQRIAILGANSINWAIALYGIWHKQATAIPIDFMSSASEIAFILKDSTPEAIFTDTDNLSKVQQAISMLSDTQQPSIIMLESLSTENPSGSEKVYVDRDEKDIALIIYTSGTTGLPKGVMLTFSNLYGNTDACTRQTKVFIPEDRVLVALPLHHTYPLMTTLIMPLSIGATAVFAESLTSDCIMKTLQTNKCTFIVGVPRLLSLFRNTIMRKVNSSFMGRLCYRISTMFNSLALSRILFSQVQQAFGGHIRYITSGGAAADPLVTQDFYALGFQLIEGYGMTETAPMISFTPPGKHKPGSPGKAIPCNTIRIVDNEVQVKGSNVMLGYLNKPQETQAVLDEEGWLRTGDLGYIDDDGFLFLTGRKKELIILGNGKNINPDEIETKVMSMSKGLIAECAACEYGEALQLIIVPDTKIITERRIVNIEETIMDEVIEYYNTEVPSYKRISHLHLVLSPLPRTRLGKLRRHILKEMLKGNITSQQPTSSQSIPTDKIYVKIASYLKDCVGREILPDEHLELSLGLDSLAKMDMLSFLNENFGAWINEETIAMHPTVRGLFECIFNHRDDGVKPSQTPYKLKSTLFTHSLMNLFMKLFLKSISNYTVEGLENLPNGAFIITPNHQSILDAFYICTCLNHSQLKNNYFYAISKFFQGSLRREFASHHNIIPMELNGDLRASIGMLENLLKSGKSLTIFPEGRRSVDGTLDTFKTTFAKLALETNTPIIPTVIDGAVEVWPRSKSHPTFGKKVRLVFMPAITPGKNDTPEALASQVKQQISSMLHHTSADC